MTRSRLTPTWAVLLAAALGVSGGRGLGQDRPHDDFRFTPDEVRAAAAATAVVGMRDPLAASAALARGVETSMWTVQPAVPPPAPPTSGLAPVLDAEVLAGVEDRTPVADPNVNPDEVRAYNYVLATASRTPFEALLKSARRDLTFVHLFEDTAELRGQVVYLEGDLRRLVRFEPSRALKKEGVKDHYEGWIYDRRYGGRTNFHCLLFTELPPEIKPGEDIDYPIAFAGYLFKRCRFRTGNRIDDAPLLMGRTIRLLRDERRDLPASGAMRQAFLTGFVVLGGLTAAVVVGLTWWYRRNDSRIRQRLARVRPVEFGEPGGRDVNI